MSIDLVPGGPVLAGRYEVRLLLYRSPSSRTWDAYDPVLDRAVAVETLDLRCGPEARAAFRAAAMQSARCTHHGLISVYDTGDDHGTAFVVTERVVGTPLDTVLSANGALTLTDAAQLMCEASDALGAAHASGLIHGALRSSSITVTANHRVKLGGFGAPTNPDRYCAPERRHGHPPSPRADVYALAVCGVEMLTGVPFDPATTSVQAGLAGRTDVPQPIVVALTRALAPDPTSRAAHVRALTRAFAPYATTATPVPPSYATPQAPTQSVATVTIQQPVVTDPPASARASAEAEARAAEPFEPRREPHVTRRIIVVLIALLALGALLAFGALYLLNRPFGLTSTTSARPVTISRVTDFDPFGDNGREGTNTVSGAADGNLSTAWSTEIYTTPAFGNAKPGVGLILETANPQEIRSVTVASAAGGWSAEIYVQPQPGTTLDAWGPKVASITDASPIESVKLANAPSGAAVLVWFTRLPDSGQLNVRELELLG